MTQRHPMFFDSDAPAVAATAEQQQAKSPRAEPRRPTWQEVQAMVDAARAAGTYNDHFQTVCHVCRRWCDGHYFRSLGGVESCKACWQKTQPAKTDAAAQASAELQRLGPSTLVLITPAAPPGKVPG